MADEHTEPQDQHPPEPPATEPSGKPATPPSAEPARVGAGYRIALDTYSGPLDLLLYLIRKEEVDLYDIPVARIAEQYQKYIELMAEINVNVAGEFLVMAATLMEIKSRMLLPLEAGMEDEEEEDPRAELVRQLLEYKRYRDLARELDARATDQALKFPRPAGATPAEEPAADAGREIPLEGIGLWELIDAFAKVLSETSIGPPNVRILERQRPVHEFRVDLLRIMTAERKIVFSSIFAECRTRDEMIAMFMALLELARMRRIRVQQSGEFGELYVSLVEEGEAPPQPLPEPAPAETTEPPRPQEPHGPAPRRPEALKTPDILSEIEEEAESIGHARARIDSVIQKTEAFLKEHHEQLRRQEPLTEPDAEPAAESEAKAPEPKLQDHEAPPQNTL